METFIMKTCLYNFDPLKSHFYIVNWGLQGYTLFCLFLLKNIDCENLLELPHCFRVYLKIFSFLEVKFSIYLNRCVFNVI